MYWRQQKLINPISSSSCYPTVWPELLAISSLKPKSWIIPLHKNVYKRGENAKNNTQLPMQDTIHTNLQIFIYTFLYTFQADLVDEFCAHIDLKWSCEQYDLLPRLWFSESSGSIRSGGKNIKYYWSEDHTSM